MELKSFLLSALLISPSFVLAEIVVDWDPSQPTGEVFKYVVTEPVVAQEWQGVQYQEQQPESSDLEGEAAARRSVQSSNDVLDELLGKRQTTCSPDWWWCPSFSRCCPQTHLCCSYGYCMVPNRTCCPNGSCPPGTGCCGNNNCHPEGTMCCSNGRYCEAGNICVRLSSTGAIVCCTDLQCTAHVTGGTTISATPTTTTFTTTTTVWRYYYWTVTWYYWYYYWSYSIAIDASIVTSSQETTRTTLSVRTTDEDAASEYFEEISQTLELPTPASATSLESLAGSTSFLNPTTSTTTTTENETVLPVPSEAPDNDNNGGGVGVGGGPGGGPDNAASSFRMIQGLDVYVVVLTMFGLAVGVVAVLL